MVDRCGAQCFFDTEELVVLGDPIRAAGSAGLDLAAVGGDGMEVGWQLAMATLSAKDTGQN